MNIPFSPPYIDDDVIAEVNAVLKSGWITTGPKVVELENAIADYCGVEKVLAVNSATSAMMLVLHWFGIGKGDEVIIPAYTYAATALAVVHLGATPVMAEVKDDFNIDPAEVKKLINGKTKAIISVDYGGWPCDYDALNEILQSAETKGLFIPKTATQSQLKRPLFLSDAAHALGSVYKNKITGSCADITVFSLHAVKNITGAEGGLICMHMPKPFNNKEVYDTMRLWSLNGQTKDAYTKTISGGWQYDIVYPGFKMNMPDLLAALALAQFRKYAESLLPRRKEIFDLYSAAFIQYEWAIIPPFIKHSCSSSYHIYPLRIKNITEGQRNKVIELVTAKKVSVNVHFIPLPMLTIFKESGYDISLFPKSYSMYCNEISLPIYPQLTNEQVHYVIDAVTESVKFMIDKSNHVL